MGMMMTKRLLATTASLALASALVAGAAAAQTVVTMNTVQIFGTIDPAKISDYTDYMAAVNLYDGLVSVDSSGNIIPELAESWTVSDDAKEVTYTLQRQRQVRRRLAGRGQRRGLHRRAPAAHQPGPGQPVRRRARTPAR